MSSDLPFVVTRAMRSSDHSFVLRSWVLAECASGRLTRHVDRYTAEYRMAQVADQLLPFARGLVAADAQDQDVILGFLLLDGARRVLTAYTKSALRRNGIMSSLVRAAGLGRPLRLCSWTSHAEQLLAHGVDLVYDPGRVKELFYAP